MNRMRTALATVVLTAVVAGVGAVLAHATVPGKNGRIVFRAALGNTAHLAIVNTDGTGERRLTHTKGVDDGHPDWSPDGSTIAFNRCAVKGTGGRAIFRIRPDGTGLKRLGPPGAIAACLRGRRTARRSRSRGAGDLSRTTGSSSTSCS